MSEENISGHLGDLLRKYRSDIDISQEKLGFEAGLHRTTIGDIETGKKSPTITTLYKICQALEIRPGKVISELDKKVYE